MIEAWNSLDVPMKVLWGITLAASLIFVIQSIMTFFGADGDADADFSNGGDFSSDGSGGDLGGHDGSLGADGAADIHDGLNGNGSDVDLNEASHGMNLLTFKNFVNFCLGFGWSAILLKEDIGSVPLLLFLSALVGVALVVAVMYLYKWLWSMQQSGNIDLFKCAKGCQGAVYIPVPAQRAGEGKVQISINNSIREYGALTDGQALKTGARVTVVEVVDSNTVLVEEEGAMIV